MNQINPAIKTLCPLAAVVALAGCSLVPGAATLDPQVFASTVAVIQTEAVQSVYIQLTQTAVVPPSATLPPPTATLLPTVAPSRTPTHAPTKTARPTKKPKPTVTPDKNAYLCSIMDLKPRSGTALDKGVNFDLTVTLKNIGSQTWNHDEIDFKYLSGAKFQRDVNALDLPGDVYPGGSLNVVVSMAANTKTGAQTANWGLMRAGSAFCYVGISVMIK